MGEAADYEDEEPGSKMAETQFFKKLWRKAKKIGKKGLKYARRGRNLYIDLTGTDPLGPYGALIPRAELQEDDDELPTYE